MGDSCQTRQSLLLRLKQHDDDAWMEFFSVYQQAIYRYCRSKGLQDADARDATQEVLAAVHRQIETWECDASKGSLRAWLFRVARNVAADQFSDRRKRTAGSGDSAVIGALNEVAQTDEAEVAALRLEYQRSLFQWAAEQVRPEIRQATWQSFWKTAIEGQPSEQVARELKLSVGTVYTAKCRVVARIRAKIAEMEECGSEIVDELAQSTEIRRAVRSLPSKQGP